MEIVTRLLGNKSIRLKYNYIFQRGGKYMAKTMGGDDYIERILNFFINGLDPAMLSTFQQFYGDHCLLTPPSFPKDLSLIVLEVRRE